MQRTGRNTWLFLTLLLVSSHLSTQAQTVRVGAISNSINNWPMWVANAKGFFKDEGLDVQLTVTGESEHQLDMVDAKRPTILCAR